jgi:hypothetical protein
MIAKLLLVLLLSGLTAGCASYRETTNAWVGKRVDDLIYRWGPPSAMSELPDGRKVVTFSHSRFIDGTQYYCNVTFRTDVSGTIVSSDIDGNLGGCNHFFANKGPPAR